MTKMVKFTNRAAGREDEPIYLNPKWIVAVFEDSSEKGSLSTMIYGGPSSITWIVEESLDEVISMIHEAE